MRAANLAVKFLLELAAVASFAVAGLKAGPGVVGALLAILLPTIAIAIWGTFCAPRAGRRLATTRRVPLELGILLGAAAALWLVGHSVLAVVLALLVVANAVGLTVFRQWEH